MIPPIVLLITDLNYGGTPRSVQALALGLSQRGYAVRVVSLFDGGDVAKELRLAGISTTGLGLDRKPVRAVWDFFRLLRRERPLILHSFLFHANLLGRVLGRLAGVPCVIASERSAEPLKLRGRVLIDRLTWRLAAMWTANAEEVVRTLCRREGIESARIAMIPTGVDPDRFSPGAPDPNLRHRLGLTDDDLLLMSVGRLEQLKGHGMLIDAFAIVAAARSNVQLVLVGDGVERETLRAQIRARNLEHRVRLAGAVGDVVSYLRVADLFVLASETEGTSGAVLEAMAVGLPVVVTAVGGTPEVVTEGESGFLVPPADASAFATAIERALSDRDSARRMGERARLRVERCFSIAATLQQTLDLYNRVSNNALVPAGRSDAAR